jgi:glycosyltransferase involved in cell wall biosynthesis
LPHVRGEGRLRLLTSRFGLNEFHCLGSFKIPALTAYAEADLLHLHCLHGGFVHPLVLPRLTRRKPAIYSLHDMWPMTGHCVHSFDCERWKTGCGRCPYLHMPDAIQRDASWLEWRMKEWSYRHSNVTFVVPSNWLYGMAKESILNRCEIKKIPYGVDTEEYRPLDQLMSRSVLGLPTGKKVLLYVMRKMNTNRGTAHIKGTDLLIQTFQHMPASIKKEMVLLLVGEGGDGMAREAGVDAVALGYVASDRLKAILYSAADLFLFPSRAENLPLVLMESFACGTPAVAFNVGGIPDLVRPGQTGFLAEPENTKQLSEGIVQLLEDEGLRRKLRARSREIAVTEYGLSLYVERHLALYREVLDRTAA